jgi:SAM-dependent methyltransferase
MENFGLLNVPGHVLEIGCGEGMLLYELQKRGWVVLGSDVNADMKEAETKLGIPILIGPFEEAVFLFRFDLVCIIHTLEHMANPSVVVEKISRILNWNGSLYVEVPTGAEEYDNLDHTQFFEPGSLAMLLSKYFRHVNVERRSYVNYDKVECGLLVASASHPRSEET